MVSNYIFLRIFIGGFIIFTAIGVKVTTADHALPVCQETCGNLSIPSPFGTRQLRINSKVAYDCYDKDGNQTSNYQYQLKLLSFFISSKRNKFTAIGCDTNAMIQVSYRKRYMTGNVQKVTLEILIFKMGVKVCDYVPKSQSGREDI
ncbi:hypothetical protein POM88_003652 [Heracleum sosnowskyi]|uniref:Uncharacterized protein n=1 Tax=Heracleum sosnowskyi TaxID=360622 RepID=A0AAD8JGQ0_9APIA|nr:hypothetical protein POM88_003652 [Heracleum sosnowskyi]